MRHPDFGAFQSLIQSSEYQEKANPHRRAALADWRLLATSQIPLPGASSEPRG